MSLSGEGTKSNPYRNFTNKDFNRLTNGTNRSLFFEGNYHHSIIFNDLRENYVANRFGGITVTDAIQAFLQSENRKPRNDYSRDFPLDLELFLDPNSGIDLGRDEIFIDYLTRNPLYQLLLVEGGKDSAIPIFHKPLTSTDNEGDLVKRILKFRRNQRFSLKKDENNDFSIEII